MSTVIWWVAHWTEVVGFVTGLACVLLAARRLIWTYPLGIANNLVFIVLFADHALYADTGLQVVYLALGVQGWLSWSRRPAKDQRVAVIRMPRRSIPWLLGAAVVATVLVALALRHTNSTTAVADAGTTVVSLVAQLMMNRRWIESWWVWIAVDVAYVGLYLVKGLLITGALYSIFIAVCVLGYRTWRRAPAGLAHAAPERPPAHIVDA